ncbi:MAG TPA: alpha/beta hydrolase [Acidimicrobiales bacterium]|nr:alpha/beta hydrolase [Acidimicrobiales bacterium]
MTERTARARAHQDDGATPSATPRHVTEGWATAGGVRVHFLDAGEGAEGGEHLAPVLVVPGFAEAAEEYRWLVEALAPRRALAMSARGRGRSDAPRSGYRFEDHVDDIDAVVSAAALGPAVLVCFSRGSSYGLGFALRRPDAVAGLVIGDYHARHVGLAPAFVEHQRTASIRGVPVRERMPDHAVAGVQLESVEVPLWDRLAQLRCPVLLVRGGRRGVLVDDAVEARYREALPGIEVAMLPRAGHDLWSRDRAAYLGVLVPFLEKVDAAG